MIANQTKTEEPITLHMAGRIALKVGLLIIATAVGSGIIYLLG